ncbi:RNA polymerase sigma factor [Azomonas macrocytogenes]|uniref:RNA polymerase sigma-70 factor (ECF subfamily) n=1 Tax=Azomonas macrocytogenes TaxID=69962 RepID=A0A839T5Z9_AZOMA|nr:RNA polymerase sigma factor [Azomonas macrocytogenes]MBB3104479.1 RNA polymerase sigma-70 factor (ECF subfamily) [Azomonas macrocytogenes]
MSTERERLLSAFIEHRDALLGYLRHRFGSPSLAEDLAQETWLRLARHTPEQNVVNPRAYLFRIATNLGTDHQRHQGMDIEVQLEDELVAQIPAQGVDPAWEVQSRDELEHLLHVVDSLPPRCREIFILCRVDGLSHAQIAERLNISKSTVVAQMVKALRSGTFCCLAGTR